MMMWNRWCSSRLDWGTWALYAWSVARLVKKRQRWNDTWGASTWGPSTIDVQRVTNFLLTGDSRPMFGTSTQHGKELTWNPFRLPSRRSVCPFSSSCSRSELYVITVLNFLSTVQAIWKVIFSLSWSHSLVTNVHLWSRAPNKWSYTTLL